jgi:drug/metabolite transporter (DMT)-like permease
VSRSFPVLIGLLAGIWGASYLFIKVAGRDFPPAALMEARMLAAGLLLAAFLAGRQGLRRSLAEVRSLGRQGLVLGVANGAIPFTLIAWGEHHIASGVAAVANATVPIFNAALAPWLLPGERVRGLRLLGVALALIGVGVLTGTQPSVGLWFVLGTLAVVLSSVSYAFAGLYAQQRLSRVGGPALATATMLGGALVLLPFALFQLPTHVPGWKPVASLAALTVLGTALGFLILFRAIRLHGSARTSLVTYLMPVTALFYGAVFLSESITVATAAGLALILCGVALGSGALRLRRARAATVAEP